MQLQLGAVRKRHPQSGGKEGLSTADIADKGGSSDADVRTFWCKKLRIFRNLWCVRMNKEGRGHFSRFCADVFDGRLLITLFFLKNNYYMGYLCDVHA